jgi:hypothetical protein
MREQELAKTMRRGKESLIIGALLYLLGRLSLKVENGQFEREYSRVYGGLVLGIAIVLGLLLLVLLWSGISTLFRHNES